VLEGISPGYIIDQESSRCTSIIRSSDASEGFLSGRVPDLQLYEFVALQIDHPGTKFNPNGQIVNRLETFVRELQQQTGFSDA
jgi:8-oxo-dGTP pyrophosphatase MutT (NUDIX family)